MGEGSVVSRLLAAALAGFCSLTISREGEGPRARLGVKVVVDPFPLIEAAAHELAGAPPEGAQSQPQFTALFRNRVP